MRVRGKLRSDLSLEVHAIIPLSNVIVIAFIRVFVSSIQQCLLREAPNMG